MVRGVYMVEVCMVGGAWEGGVRDRGRAWQGEGSMSRRYTSYWNAFLLF